MLILKEKPKKKQLNNNKNKNKSLGPIPVSTLEDYVQPDWWKRIFNSLYLKTDADVVEDESITQNEIKTFLKILQLNPNDSILDLCCGQGRHSIELASQGFNKVEGLDRSRYLIKKAKTISNQRNLDIKFKEGDARRLPYPNDSFNAVLMLGNSFGYFENIYDDKQILEEIFRVLKPQGKMLLDVTNGEFLKNNFEPRSWEWINKKMFVCRERSLSSDSQRLISREVITDVKKGVVADQFYAERLYIKDDLGRILKETQFGKISFHDDIEPASVRNQDLGMMAKRMLLTAYALKDWSIVKQIKTSKKQVAVILGDPNKPDVIKPSAIFDDDDFYTIDRLKSALSSLKNFNFIYLSNHSTLFQELEKRKKDICFVLNLCDEGFNNNPRNELHIPAILDILNIPYTGASSQCLAFCYDKSLVRGIAKEMKIPIPKAFFIEPDDNTFNLPFNFPVIVKPNYGDASFGITQNSVASTLEQLINAITEIRENLGYDKPLLVEEFLDGMDLSLGIIGNPQNNYTLLPIIKEDYSKLPEGLPQICGYEAKWLEDSPYMKNIKSVPAVLEEKTEKTIVECSLKLFERLECRDYSRFDWRLDSKGLPKLLEINPNPGWCWDGHLAKMAEFAGISYEKMIEMIINTAEQRKQ